MNGPDDTRDVASVRRALLDHYDRTCRDLPWRCEADPYRILVSEVMLQQTRVDTVLRYYGPWLDRFPDVRSLADADEEEVLKSWEGLGYYRRARNLHRTARIVRDLPGGALPTRYDELRELPGVGAYTAGAVASIAFGHVEPAVDGNVRRVLSRLFDVPDPSPGWLRRTAAGLVDPDRPGDWNQALMELGATLCSPRSPACARCPCAHWCAARAAGTQAERPRRKSKSDLKMATFVLAVFHAGDRVMLVRRPADGLLGGMWAFPEAALPAAGAGTDVPATLGRIAESRGVHVVGGGVPLPLCEHRFTHLHARYRPWAVAAEGAVGGDGVVWVTPDGADALPLPVAQRKVLGSWVASTSTAPTAAQ